jgi:hypothetical protein
MRDPQAVQCRAERIVIALLGVEQGEPAARPQQPGRLAERDLGIYPVERGAGGYDVGRVPGPGRLVPFGDAVE